MKPLFRKKEYVDIDYDEIRGKKNIRVKFNREVRSFRLTEANVTCIPAFKPNGERILDRIEIDLSLTEK